MRIAIIASGSRGDIEPYLVLPAFLNGSLNRVSYRLAQQMMWQGFRAAELGAKIRAEDGIARAVEVIAQMEGRIKSRR